MKTQTTWFLPRQWKLPLLIGIVFELVLLLPLWLLPADSAFAEDWNSFFVRIHAPALWLADRLGDVDDILVLVVAPLFWACAAYLVFILLPSFFDQKRRRFLQLALGAIVAGSLGAVMAEFLAMKAVGSYESLPRSFTPTGDAQSLIASNSVFALDLYRHLPAQPGNLIFSPYSVSAALAMTCAGARGQTEAEMTNALHFSLPPDKLHPAFGELVARLAKLERPNRITLQVSSSLWCQKRYPFTTAFLRVLASDYRAEARSVDFAAAPKTVSDEINAWAARSTDGKITHVVQPSHFGPDTTLVLCNAIYFKGRWRTQFKPGDTKPAQFHVGTNQDVTAQMMHQKCNCKLASLFDWMGDSISMQIIELPYFGGDLSMVIFLPQDVDGLPALEQQLTEQNLRQWLGKLNTAREHDVWVSLPRFKTVQSFDLKPALQSLGVRLAFGGGADFSGMDGTKWLYLSKALQQAFVEVNEQGTEAAMVTAGRVKTKSAADRFIADHPFLFLIRDCASGGILFMGRIVDPTRAN